MARPKFTPDDEQAATLASLRRIAAERERLDREADPLIAQAKKLGIPVLTVAEALGVTRKTVYRHLGHRM